jgi:hypothetical protein
MKTLFRLVIAIALLGSLSLRSLPYDSQTYTVVNTDDLGVGSLRWAINQANASIGFDNIVFAIPGAGVQTITLTSGPLPWLIDPVHINGYTQPGASKAPADGVAQLMIELDGSDLPYDELWNNGLVISASNSIVEGLSIYGFDVDGIIIDATLVAASGNVVRGNHIGVNSNATTVPHATQNVGIYVGHGASGNTIGGDDPGERNIISGNRGSGVELHAAGTTGNLVIGNRIGTNGAASNDIPNVMHGVRIYGGATGNTIGGDNTVGPLGQCGGECNVISGNNMCGVMIRGVDQPTASNVISGNYIGLNLLAGAAIPNLQGGVCIESSASNTIGGDSAGERNVISGNDAQGVIITGATSTGNSVVGNYIGLKRDGLTPNANNFVAVELSSGANGNYIGGSAAGEGNVISGNDGNGIEINGENCDGNIVLGNFIGTDSTGSIGVGNSSQGIAIYNGADNTIIGGDETGQGNVISDNDNYGITVNGASTGTVIQGNRIGTDATGTADLGNSLGVGLRSGATGNWIGGSSAAAGNLISGSGGDGIRIDGASTTGNVVAWNRIGTDATGRASIANGQHGVFVWDGADANTIGPSNIIAFNGEMGVMISGAETEGVVVTQNSIHDNVYEGIYHGMGGNDNLPPPTVTGTALGSVVISGTSTCAGCTIEVFGNNTDDYYDGERYLGTMTADGDGDWVLTLGGLAYPYLTATATSPIDGTSQFSWSPFTATVRSLFLPLVLRQYP